MIVSILGLKTHIRWMDDLGKIPFFGHVFVFLLMFIPAVIVSFIVQATVPGLHNDTGFTIALMVLLPGWNLLLWFKNIKLYFIFMPSWIFFGAIAIIKCVMMMAGIDDGQ